MLCAIGTVMVLEDIDERGHEVPGDGHPTANFAVIHPEVVALEGDVVDPTGGRKRAALGFFLEDENPERQPADVVEKSTEIGLLFLKIIDLACDALAEQSAKKTVLPENGELVRGYAFAGELHEGAGENESAKTLCAEKNGSLLDGNDAASQAKQSGIAETKNLGAETGIGTDNRADFFQVDGLIAEERVEIE